MRIQNLKCKEIINSCTCKVLGKVNDVEFDVTTGTILFLIAPAPGKWGGLICSDYEYVIPFECIQQVGPDIILVKVNEQEIRRKIKRDC